MRTRVILLTGLIALAACSAPKTNVENEARKAARVEAKDAVASAQLAVSKVEPGDRAAYAEAQSAMARADAAIKKSERLAESP